MLIRRPFHFIYFLISRPFWKIHLVVVFIILFFFVFPSNLLKYIVSEDVSQIRKIFALYFPVGSFPIQFVHFIVLLLNVTVPAP